MFRRSFLRGLIGGLLLPFGIGVSKPNPPALDRTDDPRFQPAWWLDEDSGPCELWPCWAIETDGPDFVIMAPTEALALKDASLLLDEAGYPHERVYLDMTRNPDNSAEGDSPPWIERIDHRAYINTVRGGPWNGGILYNRDHAKFMLKLLAPLIPHWDADAAVAGLTHFRITDDPFTIACGRQGWLRNYAIASTTRLADVHCPDCKRFVESDAAADWWDGCA